MCTAFPHIWFSVQRLLGVIHAIIFTGSSGSGPWALRPKRLQWLANITAGFKIAAFRWFPAIPNSFHHIVTPAQAGAPLYNGLRSSKRGASMRWHDEAKGMREQQDPSCRALAHSFFSKFRSGPESGGSITLHPSRNWESGVHLR